MARPVNSSARSAAIRHGPYLEQSSDVLLSSSLNARGNVSLHTDVGSADLIELCPGQGWRSVNGIIVLWAASSGCLGVSVPAILPFQD
eukprot:6367514-Amphidinium_carterae.1